MPYLTENLKSFTTNTTILKQEKQDLAGLEVETNYLKCTLYGNA